MSGASLIAVCGPRDGCGKTVVSTLIALCLALRGHRTILIDADPRCPADAEALLDVTVTQTLARLHQDGRWGTEPLAPLLARHGPTGLGYFLLRRPEEGAYSIPPLGDVLDELHLGADYIVADLGTDLGAETERLLLRANAILVVTLSGNAVLDQARRTIDDLHRRGHHPRRVVAIVNAVSSQEQLQACTRRIGHGVLTGLSTDEQLRRQSVISAESFFAKGPDRPLARQIALVAERVRDLERFPHPKATETQVVQAQVRWQPLKKAVHRRLVAQLDKSALLDELRHAGDDDTGPKSQVRSVICALLDELAPEILDPEMRSQLIEEILAEKVGLGPLEKLLADPRVTEIMVNGPNAIFAERSGRVELTPYRFTDDAQMLGVIERIVAPLGRRIDQRSPMVDARLPDGSRVNAIIPPLAIDGASITIRKFRKDMLGAGDLIKLGAITPDALGLLQMAVEGKMNIIISGGTGSGKTTLLNVLSSFVPEGERLVTIEDSAELQLRQSHVVRLETRPADLEGMGAITARDLVRNALRMRPDRIVVGEVRGAEALDMLQAMNTGHDGSLTTVHANGPDQALMRLVTLSLMAGLDLPDRAIREQIASAIQIIVQQTRLESGRRCITSVAEVVVDASGQPRAEEVFQFIRDGGGGQLVPTGYVPQCLARLRSRGIQLQSVLFGAS